jgi:hypothetical protein
MVLNALSQPLRLGTETLAEAMCVGLKVPIGERKRPLMSFTCPCCGYASLSVPPYEKMSLPPWPDLGEPPYCVRFGQPSYDVCVCCGYEFGNDDEPGTAKAISFAGFLEEWIQSGTHWFDESKRPAGWSLKRQLREAGIHRHAE